MAKYMPRLSTGELAVLGVLRGTPVHGYEVARRFVADVDLGLVLPLDMSTVYSMLKELRRQGLIVGERVAAGLRPPRTVYRLTPDADVLFLQWVVEPVEGLKEMDTVLLAKLYFCRALGPQAVLNLLSAQCPLLRDCLERAKRRADDAASGSFERLACASLASAARATLGWVEAERRRLAA
jgi:DNA-binding PadR family transcriptional regulator